MTDESAGVRKPVEPPDANGSASLPGTTPEAVLNALPAHLALLDAEGVIATVNDGWRSFSVANALSGTDFAPGRNYVLACAEVAGDHAEEAAAAAAGIRAVLAGTTQSFALEYPCHGPASRRWFRLMATPIGAPQPVGAVVLHIDVTERRLAEETLRANEIAQRQLVRQLEAERARLVDAQAVARIGSWETDLSTLAVTWSAETYRIFETDVAGFGGTHRHFIDCVHPDDRQAVAAAFDEASADGSLHSIVHRVVAGDGRVKIVEEVWRVFPAEGGSAARAVGTCQDVTERRAAEAVLKQSQSLLRMASRLSRLGGWSYDVASAHLEWSDEVKSIHEVASDFVPPLEEAIDFYAEEHRARITEVFGACLASGRPYDEELQIVTARGRRVWVRAIGEAVLDDEGRVVRVQGAFQDISEWKRVEEELRRSEERREQGSSLLRLASRMARIGGWKVDLPAKRVIWSDELCAIYDVPAGTVPDVEAALGFYTPEWRPAVRTALEECARDGTPYDIEVERVTAAGRRVWVRTIGEAVRNAQGQVVSVQGALQDITERKRLEQQFLRAQRMESIGTLAGGIAHDLNNVLAPILMSIGLLQKGEADTRRLRILATIEASAQRGADMVRQVLGFARGVESQRLEVHLTPLLRDVEKIANDTFLKTISVVTVVPEDLWAVTGDPTQIHQVLLNLCVNARDAMPRGGTITITAENVVLDAQYVGLNPEAQPGPHVAIHVEDTGTGMSTETVSQIFDPFFTTKEPGKGTGLGLSTSLAIVRSHGGFLQVYSEPGKGSTFRLHLPAAPASTEREAGQASEATLRHGRGELILVVDDEVSVRQITQQTLESFGYEVLVAGDGAEALALYAGAQERVALVLTDMMMPVMDGATVVQCLLRMKADLPIVAASGLRLGEDLAVGPAGVRHFLLKPYTAAVLLETVRRALDAP